MCCLICRYKSFKEITLNGGHGTTAKYYLIYIELIRFYHRFSRSIRTGNHRLYIHLLPEITKLFFAFHHQNYARWGVRYIAQ